MEKRVFYRKLLEAQIRGMLVGTYDTHENLNRNERTVFFEEVFERGFFLKNDRSGEAYRSFDEMLNDLIAGKTVLNMNMPQRKAGYFAFPKDLNAIYTDFNARSANALDPSALNMRTSFKAVPGRNGILRSKAGLAEGAAPEKPKGFFSGLWNRVVKTFTGQSSKTWRDYDTYQSELEMKNRIAPKEAAYAEKNRAEPGSAEDTFTERVLEVDRAGRMARREILAADVLPGQRDNEGVPARSREETRVQRVRELLRAQSQQEQIEYNRKSDRLKELDAGIYRDFYQPGGEGPQYATLDEALAAATRKYENEHMDSLNLAAKREIDAQQERMLGSVYQTYAWKRTPETDKLLNENAYRIMSFLDRNRENPAFQDKVQAETDAMRDRAEAIGNGGYYHSHVDFNKSEAQIKVALRELKIEGAEEYTYVTDQYVEDKTAELAKNPPAPKIVVDPQTAEEHFRSGEITEAEIKYLLDRENEIRSGYQKRSEDGRSVTHDELMNWQEFDFDFERTRLKTEDPIQDKILTLKMMRAQHEALGRGEPVPFLFRTEEEVRQTYEKARELGFIDQEQYQKLSVMEEVQGEYVDPEEQKRKEEERLRQEKEEQEAREREAKRAEKERFIGQEFDGAEKNTELNEYLRLNKLIQDQLKREDPQMASLTEHARQSLDRAMNAKFGLETYTEETALQDVTTLVAFEECMRNANFRQKYLAGEKNTLSEVAAVVKRSQLHKPLLNEKPEVDRLFLRKNEKNLTTAGLYRLAIQIETERQQEERKKSVADTLKDYSKEQRELIQDQPRMEGIQSKLGMQPPLDGEMAKEEAQLQMDATKAMAELYSDVLMKPQGSGEEVNMEALTEDLTTIALYQSLRNPEYRKAYLSLVGNSKAPDISPELAKSFREKYTDMIKNQISSSGILPKILADRTRIADFVFGDSGDLFHEIEKRNLQKGISFSEVADLEMGRVSAAENKLKADFNAYKKEQGKAAASAKYAQTAASLKTEKTVMTEISKHLKAGAKEAKKQIVAPGKAASV